MVAVAHLGQNWESDLSRRIQKDLASNHEHVKQVRSDVAEDPWTVAGLDQDRGGCASLPESGSGDDPEPPPSNLDYR